MSSEASEILTRNLELATGGADALEGLNDPQQIMTLASAYRADARFADAARAYDQVMVIDPKNSEAPVQLAMCLMHTGDLERSDTMFQKALEFYDNVSNPELWHSLGQLYALQEKTQQAEESFNQVLEAPGLASDVHFRLAALSLANGNHDQAVDLLKKALMHCDSACEGPPAAHIWFELADVYALKGDGEEAAVAMQNSGLDTADHAAWHEHGKVLDSMVGLAGKGGALRRKALRALVRAVEMTKDEPEYWHSLASLHRSMLAYGEAFSCLEHYSHLYVARYERADVTTTALRASLQEAGNTSLSLHNEVERLRIAFAQEQATNADFHNYRQKMEKECGSLRSQCQKLQQEFDQYKEWLEQMRKENRFLTQDMKRVKGLLSDAAKMEGKINKQIEEAKKEGEKNLSIQKRKHDKFLRDNMPQDGQLAPKELIVQNLELQALADSAEKVIAIAKREAKSEVREATCREDRAIEELRVTASRLDIIETKLQAARDELGLLHGTPDGEAFKAAADYKEEAEKARAIVKQLQQEVKESREHEKLARTHFTLTEDHLRKENEKLLERKADLATRLKTMDERNENDVEELRKLQAMEGHWSDKTTELEAILEVVEKERHRWQEQYEVIKGSLDGAARAAVAHEARKVVEVMSEIEAASRSFESYLDSVLGQVPAAQRHQTIVEREEEEVGQTGLAVEMGVQCDGVYDEFQDMQFGGALEGVDAEHMLQRCVEIQAAVGILLDGARDVINAQRAREAALAGEVQSANERAEDAQREATRKSSELKKKSLAMDTVIRKADARAEAEAEMRKFTEWKMRAKMQDQQKLRASSDSRMRKQGVQATQDRITEMLMDDRNAGGGGGVPGSRRPQSAHAVIQSMSGRPGSSRPSSALPRRAGSASSARNSRPPLASGALGTGSKQRPRSAMSGLPSSGAGSGGGRGRGAVAARVDHRHPGFYGRPAAETLMGQSIDLSASVESINRPQSVANVDNIIAGLEQLKHHGHGTSYTSATSSSSRGGKFREEASPVGRGGAASHCNNGGSPSSLLDHDSPPNFNPRDLIRPASAVAFR